MSIPCCATCIHWRRTSYEHTDGYNGVCEHPMKEGPFNEGRRTQDLGYCDSYEAWRPSPKLTIQVRA